jgi:sodium/potassium/calcium exchanger 6
MYFVCLVFFAATRKSLEGLADKEVPANFIWMNLASSIQGLVWSYIVSSVLIDLLTCVGILAKLNTTYLGLTILALGNALPDSLTVIALSKKGYAVMGITGVYTG